MHCEQKQAVEYKELSWKVNVKQFLNVERCLITGDPVSVGS